MTDRTGSRITIRSDGPRQDQTFTHGDVDRLLTEDDARVDEDDLIGLTRERLELEDDEISDVSIAASLAQIASRTKTRERWLATFGSPLGKHLAARGTDLNTALNALLGLAPRTLE